MVRRAPFHFRGGETALNTRVESRTDAVHFSSFRGSVRSRYVYTSIPSCDIPLLIIIIITIIIRIEENKEKPPFNDEAYNRSQLQVSSRRTIHLSSFSSIRSVAVKRTFFLSFETRGLRAYFPETLTVASNGGSAPLYIMHPAYKNVSRVPHGRRGFRAVKGTRSRVDSGKEGEKRENRYIYIDRVANYSCLHTNHRADLFLSVTKKEKKKKKKTGIKDIAAREFD